MAGCADAGGCMGPVCAQLHADMEEEETDAIFPQVRAISSYISRI